MDNVANALKDLYKRAEWLSNENRRLREALDEAQKEQNRLSQFLGQAKREALETKDQMLLRKTANLAQGGKEEVKEIRERINTLIRGIDFCIRKLDK